MQNKRAIAGISIRDAHGLERNASYSTMRGSPADQASPVAVCGCLLILGGSIRCFFCESEHRSFNGLIFLSSLYLMPFGLMNDFSPLKTRWPEAELDGRRQPFQSWVALTLNDLIDPRWPPKYVRSRDRHARDAIEPPAPAFSGSIYNNLAGLRWLHKYL
jgi:hypothetical protein